MLAGHLGAALAAKALEPRMKLGTLAAAAFSADIALWLLVIFGQEQAGMPGDFVRHHLTAYAVPCSHSLVGLLCLAVLVSIAWALWGGRRARRVGVYWDGIALIGATILFQWVLDVAVHPAGATIYPGGSAFGFGLWARQPYMLLAELAFAGAAFGAFLWRAQPTSWVRSAVLTGLVLGLGVLTVEGAFRGVPVASPFTIAFSSLSVIVLTLAAAAWADRSRQWEIN